MKPERILEAQFALRDAGFSAQEILSLFASKRMRSDIKSEWVRLEGRNDDIEKQFRDGVSMEEIGAQYNVSRARVQQILIKRGLRASDGGMKVRSKRNKAEREMVIGAYRDSHYQKIYGCSYAEMKEINGGENASRHGSMAYIYLRQRNTSINRAIEWRITLPEFAKVWIESGHLPERGRGKGKYCMSRIGDTGPYALDNVEIISTAANCSDGQHNSRGKFIKREWSHKNWRDDLGYRPREREVRDLIANGMISPREIAAAIKVTYGTAYNYVRKVYMIDPKLFPSEPTESAA